MENIYINISLLFAILINVNLSYASELSCSASENVRWNYKKERCVQCRNCRPGYFRNLTEPYTGRKGTHGDERCLKCRPCPTGTYSTNGFGECVPCKKNCTDLSREIDDACSSLHDAKCGSCISGFEDIYQNTKFPCAPSKTHDIVATHVSSENTNGFQGADTYGGKPPEIVTNLYLSSVNISSNVENGTKYETAVQNFSDDVSYIVLAVMLSLIVAVTVSVFCVISILRRQQQAKAKSVFYQKAAKNSDNDIEMDAIPHDEGSERQRYQQVPNDDPEYARAELGDRNAPGARGELSQQSTGTGSNEMMQVHLQGLGVFTCVRNKDVCTCKTEDICQCQLYPRNATVIHIKHSDKFILLTAGNICHKPTDLFRYLELECPVIYQENDNRDRDPERISEKELVLKLLNRWVEIKSENATLQVLSNALCRAKFHCINYKLYELYNQTVQTDTRL